jgi:TPR repeat protein/S1-C subfamily serine protease
MRHLLKAGLLTLVLCLRIATLAAAGPVEDGLAAYNRGDYATALRLWRPLADQGDAHAQDLLGLVYANGQGVPKDYAAAMMWLRKAADQGLGVAQSSVGSMYENGQGVPKGYAAAMKWYRKAADQGVGLAQDAIGFMYIYGRGVPHDGAEAFKWFRKAAEHGDASGESMLGAIYEYMNRIVPQDYALAATWYRKAAEQGDARAQFELGALYETGQGVPQDYALAYKWYGQAADGFSTSDADNRDKAIRGRFRVIALLSLEQRTGSKLVVSVQQALDNLGFDAGPPDGRVGTRTQFAIWEYERSVGLPQSIGLPDNEQITPELVASVQTTLALAERQVSSLPQQGLKVTSTGSGFYISNAALLLTNYHVVEGCKAISIHGQVASLVSFDPKDDLAVLHTPPRSGSVAALRLRPAVRAGERVVAVGFPLTGFLAAQANVTTGDVSSLAGIGNDSRYLQITAPVQPGNSGGPLFDASGNVIGVVSAKLDAIKVAGITGDIPENVNFALKAVVVEAFLIFHFITFQTATSNAERSAPDIGDWGKSITELIECWQ